MRPRLSARTPYVSATSSTAMTANAQTTLRMRLPLRRSHPVDDGVQLADLHGELVVDDDHLTARDEDVVDVQVDGLARQLVELEHAPGRHRDDLAQRKLRLAQHRRDLQRHVVDQVEV